MPLPVSERYGKGAVKRRQAQEQQPNGGKKARRQAQAQQQQQSQHLKQTMVELGLEGGRRKLMLCCAVLCCAVLCCVATCASPASPTLQQHAQATGFLAALHQRVCRAGWAGFCGWLDGTCSS
jgi:hypothetical protein